MTEASLNSGLRNLLVHCGKAKAGQRLMIAYEPTRFGYCDGDIIDALADEAHQMGLDVEQVDVGFRPRAVSMPQQIVADMAHFDIVIFLARLGDQLRFADMPKGPKIINSYALNQHLMQSAFSTAHYDAFVELKIAVDRLIARSAHIEVSCPAGTAIHGRPGLGDMPATDTSLSRFPISVFSPIPAKAFSGRVALGGFLTGTGSRYYDDYTIEFQGQVYAQLSAGQLTGFTGESCDVNAAEAQYDRVAKQFGIARNTVHSWHAGIHPGCGFPWDMRQNYERWGGMAFGNPRILHFHTCGDYAPGEISWNVFDPTIVIDGLTLWDDGVFHADRLPEGARILERYPCAAASFAEPDRNIGLAITE